MELMHALYYNFLFADQAWSAALVAKYGKRSGDARYINGEGNQLPEYAAFRVANDLWLAAAKASRGE